MSALGALPVFWPVFKEKFPIRQKLFPPGKELDELNKTLTENILEASDALQKRSQAKCLMTRWNMHEKYDNFYMVGMSAIDYASRTPLALRSTDKGEPEDIPYYIKETWGLVYKKGEHTGAHTHWPSLWGYTYCVKACSSCAPLVFPKCEEKYEIIPQTGQLVIFPAWLHHEVPVHECDHDRIMISGNLDVEWTRWG